MILDGILIVYSHYFGLQYFDAITCAAIVHDNWGYFSGKLPEYFYQVTAS